MIEAQVDTFGTKISSSCLGNLKILPFAIQTLVPLPPFGSIIGLVKFLRANIHTFSPSPRRQIALFNISSAMRSIKKSSCFCQFKPHNNSLNFKKSSVTESGIKLHMIFGIIAGNCFLLKEGLLSTPGILGSFPLFKWIWKSNNLGKHNFLLGFCLEIE